MIAFSFENLAEGASLAASTTFTEAETGVGLRFPTRPNLRGYSPDLATHRITLDFGVATALQVVAPIHANFTTASVQGHASDSWGAPTYNPAAITLGRAANGRYHHAHRPTAAVPFNYRYLSLRVPTGDTTDGTVRWALGGIWAGLLTYPPRDLRMEPLERLHHARKDIATEDGRRIQRLTLDDPCFWFTARRHAENDAALEAWREFDRQWAEADAVLVLWDETPAHCYVMRRDDEVDEWPNRRVWSEGTWSAFEVTAG